MKKFLAIALIAASFAACNDGAKKEETPAASADSLVTDANKMADSAKMMADTASKMMTDTASKMMDKVADTAHKMMDKAADKMKDAGKTLDKAADKMKEKKP